MDEEETIVELDGAAFDSLEGFYDEVSRKLIPGAEWGRNLDAFNDILRGGFGGPETGFTIRWLSSARSRKVLGHEETARWIEARMKDCHPSNLPMFRERLAAARRGEGETLFDTLVEIIRIHGPGGREADDCIDLELA